MSRLLVRLPVDDALPELRAALERSPNAVLEAPPGAGKTTRVPPALLPLLADRREVLVLEPRRLAARLAARRVAEELGEPLGETVGYQVRFDEVSSARTRIRFLTEGVLTRRLLSDPLLERAGLVILDEFHERHLDGDLALALLLRLQRTQRPDLRLLVMSATLDAEAVARHLGDCPRVRSEGRLFDTALHYTPASADPVARQVARALEGLLAKGPLPGDALVFLPGAREIRESMEVCGPLLNKHGILSLPLSGDLSPEEQDRAVQPASRPKVIFSTNVAESSVTIEGVRVVIDSGLARIAEDSPWTGLPSLHIKRIAQSSARQRAGRAARLGPGMVIRLYTAEDFARRPAQDTPEVLRRELAQLVLDLRSLGLDDPRELPWLDPPPDSAIDAARALLDKLGAHGETARQMARLPLHPRLARMLLEANARGARRAGCEFAAELAGSGDAGQVARQLDRLLPRASGAAPPDPRAMDKAALAAFPDRVARKHRDREIKLAGGGSALLARDEHQADWLIAIDIEERRDRGLPIVRQWAAIEAEWLIDFFPDAIEERAELEWNREAERLEAVQSMRYGQLTIDASRGRPADREAASAELARRAFLELHRFVDPEDLEAFRGRVLFASRYAPGLAPVTDDAVRAALAALGTGCVSFAELTQASRDGALIRMLEAGLGDAALLDRIAPKSLRLPSGRQTRIHYPADKGPWAESRLQDFFGMKRTPSAAQGQAPLTLHLLAPNRRPVQITQDLEGFWERHYPAIRRELSRRYPKHAWPEDPLASS